MRAWTVAEVNRSTAAPPHPARLNGLLALQRLAGNQAVGAWLGVVQRINADEAEVGSSYRYVHTDGNTYTNKLKEIRRGGWYLFDNGHKVHGAGKLTAVPATPPRAGDADVGEKRVRGTESPGYQPDKRRRIENSPEGSPDRLDEPPASPMPAVDAGEPAAFAAYPGILGIVRRPGHNNPYRSGLGAADTTAALIRDGRELLARNPKVGADRLAELERQIAAHGAAVKRVNDNEEVALLTSLHELDRQRGALLDDDKLDEDADGELAEKVAAEEEKLDGIRAAKRGDLDALRKIFQDVLWLSEKDHEDRNEPVRAEQVRIFYDLKDHAESGASYQEAEESNLDPWKRPKAEDDEQAYPPILTHHHSEQRLIVSTRWLDQLNAIQQEVAKLAGEKRKDQNPLDLVAAGLTPRELHIVLNRSSCAMCNAFLVAELLRFWAELSKVIGCDSDKARDVLTREKLIFKISYSVVYSKSADIITTLDAQLTKAGWQVSGHRPREGSPAEQRHERLAQGRAPLADSGEASTSRTRKRKKKKNDDDADYQDPSDRKGKAKSKKS